MKKIIVALALATMASAYVGSAYAGISTDAVREAGFSRLTESQKAEVLQLVAQRAKPDVAEVDTVDKIDKWVQVGSNLGKGLAATAKELGVAVNDFANTPIGKLATVLIVWHIIGTSLIHIFGGICIWIFGAIAVRFIVERAYPTKLTFDSTQRNIFGNHPITARVRQDLSSEMVALLALSYAVVGGAGLWTIFTM